MTAPLSSTRYSLDFVGKNLPESARRILEVGCGRGDLAAALQADGYRMLAIDSDADAVAQATARGVEAVQLTWPAKIDQQFDAVLFTHSLHHIEPLDDALSAAMGVLKTNGRILVDDHRTEGVTSRSSAWYSSLVRLFESLGAFGGDFDAAAALSKIAPDEHGHELHSSRAIAAALERVGEFETSDAAYYFRYLEPAFRSSGAAERMLEHEVTLVDSGAIDALGIRFVVSTA